MTARRSRAPAEQADLFGQEREAPAALAETRPGAMPRMRLGATVAGRPARRPPSEQEMARCLEETGRYRILRQLQPRPVRPLPEPRAGRRIGVILDTETTGLDHASHEVIELGMVAFTFDADGIGEVVGVFSALREPSTPVGPEITRITGITDEMVRGHRIDPDAVRRFVEPADLVIAHNARFDRPFCEALAPGFDRKPWACSVAEVDWAGLGFEGTKLGYLVGQSGFFHNGHRAVDDCHALLEVLAGASRRDGVDPPFAQLLRSAGRARLRVLAVGAPFHAKDLLKARGYRWSDGANGKPKCWWREIDEEAHEAEAAFLAGEVYGRAFEAPVERLTALDRFRA